MPYLIRYSNGTPDVLVNADEHRVEGAHHVLRRTVLVMGQPRRVVALRVPLSAVTAIEVVAGDPVNGL